MIGGKGVRGVVLVGLGGGLVAEERERGLLRRINRSGVGASVVDKEGGWKGRLVFDFLFFS